MNLQYCTPKEAADYLNTTTHELSDYNLKGVLINALDKIQTLEAQVKRLNEWQDADDDHDQAKATQDHYARKARGK